MSDRDPNTQAQPAAADGGEDGLSRDANGCDPEDVPPEEEETPPEEEETPPPPAVTAQVQDEEPNCENDDWIDEGHYGAVQFKKNDRGDVIAVVLVRTNSTDPIPPEMRTINAKANQSVTIIRRRFSDHEDKATWLDLICTSTRNGVVGERADPQAALTSFKRLEEMLIQAARPKRQKYIFNLFLTFLVIVVIAGVAYWLLNAAVASAPTSTNETFKSLFQSADGWVKFAKVQLTTIAGLALGVLFSGIVQNRVLSIETLEHFDPAGFSTFERLLYVWVVASTLEVLVWFEAIVIGVGGKSFAEAFTNPWHGVLVGLVTALSTELVIQAVGRAAKPTEQTGA